MGMLANINPMKIAFWILSLLVLILGIFFYKTVLSYVLCSLVFTYLLTPLVRFFEKKQIGRTLSVVIVYLSLTCVLLIVSIFVIPPIISQIEDFAKVVSDFVANNDSEALKSSKYVQFFVEKLDLFQQRLPFIDFQKHQSGMIAKAGAWASALPSKMIGFIRELLTLASFLITIPIIGFFLMKDSELFIKQFYKMIPNRYFELVSILVHKVDEIIGRYLRALMMEVLIVGVMTGIVLSFIGVPYSLLIGLVAGFANAIPYFGPVIALLSAITTILLTGEPMILIVYALIGMQLVQNIDNNIVYPIIMGKNTDMHPLVIMLTVIAGGYSMGILGMFLSVPVVFLIRSMITVLYKNLKEFELI